MRIKMSLGTLGSFVFLVSISCTWKQLSPQIDCSLSPVEISLLESTSTSCGASDGGFVVSANGGEPPYLYSIGTGTNSDGTFENMAAGTYQVTATDAKGCSIALDVPIQNLSGVNLNEVVASTSGCDTSNGSISISASGGEEPYLYSIGGNTQANNVFTGLDNGTYTVSVQDQQGCEVSQSIEVHTGVSYKNSVESIIANSCATTSCHGGSISPDLRSFSTIQARANSIKSRTGNKSMPKGSSLSQEQIDMIACWVNDGALQN